MGTVKKIKTCPCDISLYIQWIHLLVGYGWCLCDQLQNHIYSAPQNLLKNIQIKFINAKYLKMEGLLAILPLSFTCIFHRLF